MKKFIALVIIAGSILVFGCSKQKDTTNIEETQIDNNQEVFKWTIKSLLENKKNVECSFTFEDENVKEEWTSYIQNWKMKSVAKVFMKKENINMESYSVTKDDYTYTRSNLENAQWAKFKNIDNNKELYNEDPLDDKEINFICKSTKIDESIFEIPTDISFIDITEYFLKK